MYQLSSEVYLDKREDQYKNVITISPKPTDPTLAPYLKRVNLNKYDITNPYRYNSSPYSRSSYSNSSCGCSYGFINICDENEYNEYVTLQDLPNLIIFLQDKGSSIDTGLSKIMFMNKELTKKNFIGFLKK